MTMSTMEAPSLFSSLPNDIVLNVVARVPRRYYPILSCVSKKMRSLVRSSELERTRSLMGKDCFYLCLEDFINDPYKTYHWFTLTQNRRLVPIPLISPPESYAAVLMVGPDIYFVGGNPSRSLWIFDSQSGKLRQGPSSLVATPYAGVGMVDEKIHIFGGGVKNKENQAQVFDLKTQTWQVAPNPSFALLSIMTSVVNPSLGRLIYARTNTVLSFLSYDPRDGKVNPIFTPYDEDDHLYSKDLCVIDNVLYMHYPHVGLMWYNSKKKQWRTVCGLKLNEYFVDLSLAEYNGKLAFLWRKPTMELWCTIITLYWNGLDIQGSVEWSDCLLSNLPVQCNILHYFGRTD